MQLKNKSILLISPQPWQHIQVSKHHYAIKLAERGNKVYFLNPPSTEYEERYTAYENLRELDYGGFWPGLHYLPAWMRKINQRRVFRRLAKLVGTTFDIIWSFDNSVFYDFDCFPKASLTISHIVDLNQEFQHKRASSSAQFCFGVIPEIVKRHEKYNARSYLIRHGVNLHQPQYLIKKLPGGNSKKTVYFGNLAMPHLDWQLLEKAAHHLSEIDFIFIGSNHDQVPVRNLENVLFVPQVDSKQLVDYMHLADVLLLFYSPDYFTSYASPHKLLEYLSSGKPIVSTIIKEYQHHQDLIYQANNENEWIKLLQKALSEKDVNVVTKRKQLAEANTYEQRIKEMEKILAYV